MKKVKVKGLLRLCLYINGKRKFGKIKGYNRKFQLLHECEYIYRSIFGKKKKKVFHMYYDPPKLRILNSISLTNGLIMQFQGKVSRINAHVLVATPISHCYLNSTYVKRIGLRVVEYNGKGRLGNGLESELEEKSKVHFKIQQYQSQVSCLVTKLHNGFDLILGDDWLSKNKVHLDYESKTCILYKGNKKVTIHNVIASEKKVIPSKKFLLALQFKRAVRKGSNLYLFI
jgi:hypothetical protein